MIDRIINYCEELLVPDQFDDYCPNGLQVEGKKDIKKIITGVTACIELFDKAIAADADLILVHHGLIWYEQKFTFTGSYRSRLKLLLDNDINLLAYHLPLDGNIEVGNAAVIAARLGMQDVIPDIPYQGNFAGISGNIETQSLDSIKAKWTELSARELLVFPYGTKQVSKIAIASGGGHKEIYSAINIGADLFITGEVSEQIMHIAKEEGINFFSAGHHETEKFGVQALGERLSREFGLQHEYIDVYNPV